MFFMMKDPVCGMMVDEKKAKFKSDYMGKTYYFCAQSCKATFDKDPTKFSGSGGKTGHSCCCGGHC
jgi:Cu+-exporting ATPase